MLKFSLLISIFEIPGYILLDISVFTNYHRLGDLKQLEFVIVQTMDQEYDTHLSRLQSRCLWGCIYFQSFKGEMVSVHFYTFQRLCHFLAYGPLPPTSKPEKEMQDLHIGSPKASLLSLGFKDHADYIRHPWITQNDLSI